MQKKAPRKESALPHPTQTAFQRNQSSTVAFTQKIKRATPTTRCCPPSSKGFAGFLAASLSSGSQQAWDQSTGNVGRHHISPEMPQLAGLTGWHVVGFGELPRLWQPRRDAGSPLQPSLGWKEKSPIPLGAPDAAAVADDDVPHGFNQFNLRSTFYRRINNVAKVLFDISVGNGICISSGNFFIIEMRGKNYLGFVAYRQVSFKILHKHEIILFGFSSSKLKPNEVNSRENAIWKNAGLEWMVIYCATLVKTLARNMIFIYILFLCLHLWDLISFLTIFKEEVSAPEAIWNNFGKKYLHYLRMMFLAWN